ncbi:hypothetical protein CAMRE0001_2952 [Campylobacter rectus RM3267]|uniref:Uncharacterized protein n=1 Tax=Campylobacter rectus RM3267 TaxID=553218 RepID=B9D2A8_CAMRE|nr:hypothetical protein CAMRE0001_2952 [Campylobacter rectus RM3267]
MQLATQPILFDLGRFAEKFKFGSDVGVLLNFAAYKFSGPTYAR